MDASGEPAVLLNSRLQRTPIARARFGAAEPLGRYTAVTGTE
jgi:hypothetical protein